MKRTITTILAITLTCLLTQAQVKEVNPHSIRLLNFNAQGEKEYNERYAKAEQLWTRFYEKEIGSEDFTAAEQEILNSVNELDGGYWDAMGGGCSWYCGGGPYEVTASSHLSSQAGNSYEPDNAHDLSFSTAWVEGAENDGVGEFLTYHFNSFSPRITQIFIANGYVKSQTAWENNGRVKKLKMYVNDKPYAILCLEDSRSEQAFEFLPIGRERDENGNRDENAKDWTLKFEIMEVYKGKKYSDVAISEIYFNGIDVHCFAKGTLVDMANGTAKAIEELVVGDEVKIYNFDNYKPASAAIGKLEKVNHTHLVKYIFSNGKEITVTPDHPFMVKGKGWSSMKPEQTKQYKSFDKVSEIKEGDGFLMVNGGNTFSTITLTKIEQIHEEQETYTIAKLSSGNNFLVEGFIVGVEELQE